MLDFEPRALRSVIIRGQAEAARQAEIERLVAEQAADDEATQTGKIIRENCMTSQYGLQGENLLCCEHVTPARGNSSDHFSDRVEGVLVDSVRVA